MEKWDQNWLWGTFQLGNIKGIFLIDPGATLLDLVHPKPRQSAWRGTFTDQSDCHFNDPRPTTGKITWGGSKFFGHFDGILRDQGIDAISTASECSASSCVASTAKLH